MKEHIFVNVIGCGYAGVECGLLLANLGIKVHVFDGLEGYHYTCKNCYDNKKLPISEQIYNEVLKKEANNAYAYYYRGLIYDEQKQTKLAINDYLNVRIAEEIFGDIDTRVAVLLGDRLNIVGRLSGIVEGITEWLPISSTGHLILVEQFLKFEQVSPEFWSMFQVVIQFGAILAVVVLYFKKIWPFTKNKDKAIKKG